METLSKVFEKNINDNETITDITNIMANKIIKYALMQKEYNKIEDFDNQEIVQWFLPRYNKATKDLQLNNNDKPLKNLLNLLSNTKLELENKNENTLFTK